MTERDIDLNGLSARLHEKNPGLTSVRAEATSKADADIRVVVETTRAELAAVDNQLHLTDPDLEGLQIETMIKFLDHKPGEQLRVGLRKTDTAP
jgi:hypothetical protein